MPTPSRVFRRISLLLVASYLSLITQPLQAAVQKSWGALLSDLGRG